MLGGLTIRNYKCIFALVFNQEITKMRVTNIKQLINGAPNDFNLLLSIGNEVFDIDYEKSYSEKTINIKLNKVSTPKVDAGTKNITEKVRDVLFACTLDIGRVHTKFGQVVSSFDLKRNKYEEFTVVLENSDGSFETYFSIASEIAEMGLEIVCNLNPDNWADYERRRSRILKAVAALEIASLDE